MEGRWFDRSSFSAIASIAVLAPYACSNDFHGPTPMIALAGNYEELLSVFLESESRPRSLAIRMGGPPTAGRDFKKIQAACAFPQTPSAIPSDAKGLDGHRRLLFQSCRRKTGRSPRSPGSR